MPRECSWVAFNGPTADGVNIFKFQNKGIFKRLFDLLAESYGLNEEPLCCNNCHIGLRCVGSRFKFLSSKVAPLYDLGQNIFFQFSLLHRVVVRVEMTSVPPFNFLKEEQDKNIFKRGWQALVPNRNVRRKKKVLYKKTKKEEENLENYSSVANIYTCFNFMTSSSLYAISLALYKDYFKIRRDASITRHHKQQTKLATFTSPHPTFNKDPEFHHIIQRCSLKV